MPKPTCQLNLTLDVPTAEWVERIARGANLRPSGAGRVLLEHRLKLESAGWAIDDTELGEILNGVAGLNDKDREAVRTIVKRAGS